MAMSTPEVTPTLSDSNGNEAGVQTQFTIQEISDLLPHRYPFALVDRIIDFQPGKCAVGLKNVTINEPFFPGHIPEIGRAHV